MLNSSVLLGPSAVPDSPAFVYLPTGMDFVVSSHLYTHSLTLSATVATNPDPLNCTVDMWAACGTSITSSADECRGESSDDFRTMCYLSHLSAFAASTQAFTIAQCCPCSNVYADKYGYNWALLTC
jgi:hypothetical protein